MLSGICESPEAWLVPRSWPRLLSGAVHVWRVPLHSSARELDQLWQLLSADEQQRADRFTFPEHRQHFIACRARLRQTLGRYLDQQPNTLTFRGASRGKPYLDATSSGNIEFNISHAENIALFAFSRAGPVGIDVERIRTLTADLWALAAEHFTPTECVQLRTSPSAQQLTAFFRGWTRKEALIKADGAGLSCPLNQVEVGLGEYCSSSPVRFPPAAQSPFKWRLHSLALDSGYLGALAAPANAASISYFALP